MGTKARFTVALDEEVYRALHAKRDALAAELGFTPTINDVTRWLLSGAQLLPMKWDARAGLRRAKPAQGYKQK